MAAGDRRGGAGRARRRGAPGRRTRRGRADASGQRVAAARAVAGRGLRVGRRRGRRAGGHRGSEGTRRPRRAGVGSEGAEAGRPVTTTHRIEQEADERPADERDPPDVARDVGVFLGGARGEPAAAGRARRRLARCGSRVALRVAASAARSSATIWPPRARPRAPLPLRSASAGRAASPASARRRRRRAGAGRWPGRDVLPRTRLAMVGKGLRSIGSAAPDRSTAGRQRQRIAPGPARRPDAGRALLDSATATPEDPPIDLDALVHAVPRPPRRRPRRRRAHPGRRRHRARPADAAARAPAGRPDPRRGGQQPRGRARRPPRQGLRGRRERRRRRRPDRPSSRRPSARRSSASGSSATTRSRRRAATRASRWRCSTRAATAGSCRACTPASGTRVYAKAITAGRVGRRPVGRGDRGARPGDGLTA